ncbi:hypothetical protein [Zhouia amylolytica]|uniref:Uncharacterized protein n=1 Tax=Zhouia amylolytica AD3 TaxID=1286632 RepID=W2UR01_9FLAO|nr:hypothetical protein [Zhouia amylolytica]ETN96448.1 hypothetical protein P278_05260 [Zhouia amylolytica AD3]
MIETNDFFNKSTNKILLGADTIRVQQVNQQNIDKIAKIASSVYNPKAFKNYRDFIYRYAQTHPINDFKFEHQSIRDDYLLYTNTPDSLAIQTVGSLSEVVADMSNRIDFGTDLTGKQLKWSTQLYLKEKGIDSIEIQNRIAAFDDQVNRLLIVAENAPETIDTAIISFRNQLDPLFYGMQQEIEESMIRLSEDRIALELMIERERIALDSIIMRERKALTDEAKIIADIGVKNGMSELRKTISSLLLYAVIFLVILLGLPFYLGYLTGKNRNKEKNKDS